MTLAAREAFWRRRTQFYRRAEARQRKRAMDAQKAYHDALDSNPQKNALRVIALNEKARLEQARKDRRQAEAALAKIREQIAKDAPPFRTAEQIGLRFTYPFGLKGRPFRGAGHYTAGRRCRNLTELVAEARSIHRFHASKGWGGGSYEALVADDGSFVLMNPANRKSAAVAMTNTGMVNICCPGTTGNTMTAAQKNTIAWLLDNLHTAKVPKAHRLPAPATGFKWRGHREYPLQQTLCPGDMLGSYRQLFARTG